MGKKKKIALLMTIWSSDYLKAILEGIRSRISTTDIRIDVYLGFDIDEWEGETLVKEREFYSIVNAESYDGALVAIGAFNYLEAVRAAAKRFTDAKIPVVSIESPIENAPNVRVDNYEAFYSITEHILRDHKCTIIDYVGGPEGAPDANIRLKAFNDCCQKYGIPEENIHRKSYFYMFEDGKQAYLDFKSENLHTPDAVICANDSMARGYLEAAREDGFNAPSDFLITGFDNDKLSRNYVPSISTVDVNLVDSAYTAVDLLLSKMDGAIIEDTTFTKAKIIRAQSCGCVPLNSFSPEKILALHKVQEIYDNRSLCNRLALQYISDCSDLTELQNNMQIYSDLVQSKQVVIALNQRLLNGEMSDVFEGYDNDMVMVTKDNIYTVDRRRNIYPKELDENATDKIFIICPLYYNTSTFGYVCYGMSDMILDAIERRSLSGYLSVAVASLRQKIALRQMNAEIEKMNHILKDLSVTDALTGLHNRLGYAQMGREFFSTHDGKVFFLYIDMDRLKYINDTMGHEMGNVAIVSIADGIRASFPETDLKIRMGGDEFLVIGAFDNEDTLKQHISSLDEYLLKVGLENKLPIPLAASSGYVIGKGDGTDFEEMVKMADAKMYEVKQAKKRL